MEAIVSTITRSTFKLIAVAATVAALTLAGGGIANAKTGGVPAIPLNNEQAGVVDTGASGFLSYTIEGTQFCYTLEVRHLSKPVTVAHIHIGARNAKGPVVIPLVVGSGTDWTVKTCVGASPTVLAGITANPRGYYVNVHSEQFTAGEIRGQLK
jgi:hypothetical protein